MSNPGPFLIQPLVPKPIKEGEPITLFSSAFGNDGDQNTMFMGKNQTVMAGKQSDATWVVTIPDIADGRLAIYETLTRNFLSVPEIKAGAILEASTNITLFTKLGSSWNGTTELKFSLGIAGTDLVVTRSNVSGDSWTDKGVHWTDNYVYTLQPQINDSSIPVFTLQALAAFYL